MCQCSEMHQRQWLASVKCHVCFSSRGCQGSVTGLQPLRSLKTLELTGQPGAKKRSCCGAGNDQKTNTAGHRGLKIHPGPWVLSAHVLVKTKSRLQYLPV